MSKEVNKGVVAKMQFQTLDKPNGSALAPDAAPVAKHLFIDGVATAPTGIVTITQKQDTTPADIVGLYEAAVVTAGMTVNNQVQVIVEATISGVTKQHSLCFTVVDVEAGTPTIVSC